MNLEMTWWTGAMLAFGAACLVLGFRVRAGSSRTFYGIYRTNAWQRNAAFALIPAGIWLIAAAGAIVSGRADIGIAVGLLTAIAFLGLIVSVVWIFRPPEFMKPRWLRQVESGTTPEPTSVMFGAPSPSGARRIYLPPAVYWGLWAVTAVIFVLWLLLDWPTGVLVGLGAAISLLAAHTPKKRTRAL
jgi:hypothetical protein